MSQRTTKNTSPELEPDKIDDLDNLKEFWTEHRTTLIAFETQYVHAKKPKQTQEEEGESPTKRKTKKKVMGFDSGFLLQGRGEAKQVDVEQLIHNSKYNHLRELFNTQSDLGEDMLELREFVKIMLELKHCSIIHEFMGIYDLIIREIKPVKFEAVKGETNRENKINCIANQIAGFIKSHPHNFKTFTAYMREDEKETLRLFKVTAYCFLAEKHCFNINEYYAEAFDYKLEETKAPKKKRKLDV